VPRPEGKPEPVQPSEPKKRRGRKPKPKPEPVPPTPEPAPEPEPEPVPIPDPQTFLQFIKDLPESARMPGGAIRIAELKSAIPELPVKEVDTLLIELQMLGWIVLYPFTSPADITRRDWDAAVRIGGDARHMLYVK
jgi:hypothetical protein